MLVKAEGPSGRAKILAQYLRTIGYNAWIEDTNGDEIEEGALKVAIRSRHTSVHHSMSEYWARADIVRTSASR